MRTIHILVIIVLLALALPAVPAHAGGVVTVCDEAHLLTAQAGGGMVTFACSGTIVLTTTITIAADTTIDGSGQDVTISGNDAVRVFYVLSGARFDLVRLRLVNGRADSGGGIYNNHGAVTVSNVAVCHNSAVGWYPYGGGGIFNSYGALTVSNSIVCGNAAMVNHGGGGGGIYNYHGTLTVSNSNLSGNSAGTQGGGGIYNVDGMLAVTNSTFSDNRAFGIAGGGIRTSTANPVTVDRCTFSGNSSYNQGGGIETGQGTLIVSNSTFSENSADAGGGILNYGTLIVRNSTVVGNQADYGGGILNVSGCTVTLKNTVVANSPTGGNCSGIITDGGGNLSHPDTTCPGINADPVLGPLQDNGGPTWTMALGEGSAAIDAADDATCAADPVGNRDQRGMVRPQGVHCDSGAFERPIKWLPIMLVE